jgi:hypothetical protein
MFPSSSSSYSFWSSVFSLVPYFANRGYLQPTAISQMTEIRRGVERVSTYYLSSVLCSLSSDC